MNNTAKIDRIHRREEEVTHDMKKER